MNYEKVSINVDNKLLAKIDLLVSEGFYSTRSDFIVQAIQKQTEKESKNIDDLVNLHSKKDILDENQWFFGVASYSKKDLQTLKNMERQISIKGFGVVSFSNDCSNELIFSSVKSISKHIAIHSNKEVVNYYRGNKVANG